MNTLFNPDKLHSLRESKGLTQDRFGKLIGVQAQHVSNWERGINRPSDKNLAEIMKQFGVDIDYFYGENK